MTVDLGSALLRMGVDTSGLDKGLAKAAVDAAAFSKQVQRDMDQMDRASSASSQQMATNVSGSFKRIIEVATGVSLANVGERLLAIPKQLATMALDAVASYERLGLTLETLAAKEIRAADNTLSLEQAMVKAKVAAKDTIEWVEKLAVESPFTSEGVAQAFRMAQAYGFTGDEAKRLTQAMIDFASGSGATEASMARIAMVMGQIKAAGRLLGQDMMQLTSVGMPVMQILADYFKTTTAEIVNMREKGLIPAKEAVEAITTYMETNFAGAAKRQANSWAGLLSTLQDLKAIALRDFFTPMFTAVQPYVQQFTNMLGSEELRVKLREIGTILGNNIGNAIKYVVANGSQLILVFKDILIAVLAIKAAMLAMSIIGQMQVAITAIMGLRTALIAVAEAATLAKVAMASTALIEGGSAAAGGLAAMTAAIGVSTAGIGLFVIAIAAAVAALVIFINHQQATEKATRDATVAFITANKVYDDYRTAVLQAGEGSSLLTKASWEMLQATGDVSQTFNAAADAVAKMAKPMQVFKALQDTKAIADLTADAMKLAEANPVFADLALQAGVLTQAQYDAATAARAHQLEMVAEARKAGDLNMILPDTIAQLGGLRVTSDSATTGMLGIAAAIATATAKSAEANAVFAETGTKLKSMVAEDLATKFFSQFQSATGAAADDLKAKLSAAVQEAYATYIASAKEYTAFYLATGMALADAQKMGADKALAEAKALLDEARKLLGYTATAGANKVWGTGGSNDFYTTLHKQHLAEDTANGNTALKRREDAIAANKKIADDYKSRMTAAVDAIKSALGSMVDSARQNLEDLLPDDIKKKLGLGDMMAPGANGPFENIYRAADVAVHGAASPWAEKLGLTQEAAQQMVKDFANGFVTADIEKLIGPEGIALMVNKIKMDQAAKVMTDNFIAKVAGLAGVGDKVVRAMLGGTESTPVLPISAPIVTDIATSAKATVDGFVAGIVANRAAIETALAGPLAAMIVNTNTVLGTTSPSTVFATIGGFVVAGLTVGLETGWSALVTMWQGLAATLAPMLLLAVNAGLASGLDLSVTMTAIATWWTGVTAAVAASVVTWAASLAAQMAPVWASMTAPPAQNDTQTSGGALVAEQFFTSILTTITNNTEAWGTQLQTAFAEVLAYLFQDQSSTAPESEAKTGIGAKLIASILADLPPDALKDRGAELQNGFIAGVTDASHIAQKALSAFFEGLLESIATALGTQSPSTKTAVMGEDVVKGFQDGLDKLADDAIEDMRIFGQDLITGAKTGIDSKVGEICEAAAAAVRAAIQAARDAAAAASPSRETALLGEDLMAGLAVGIITGASIPIDAISGMMQDLITALEQGIGSADTEKLQDQADAISSVLDTVLGAVEVWNNAANLRTNVDLKGLAAWFQNIATELAGAMLALQSKPALADLLAKDKDDNNLFQDFADALGAAIEPFNDMLDFWTQLAQTADLRRIVKVDVAAVVSSLREQLAIIATELQKAQNDPAFAGVGSALSDFADQLSQIPEPFSAILDFAAQLYAVSIARIHIMDTRTTTGASTFVTFVDQLVGYMWALKQALTKNSAAFTDVNTELIILADQLAAVIAPFGAILNFWAQLNAIAVSGATIMDLRPTGEASPFVQRVDQLVGYMWALKQALTKNLAAFTEVEPALVELAARLDGLVLPFATVLNFWASLNAIATSGTSIMDTRPAGAPSPFVQRVDQLVGYMWALKQALGKNLAAFAEVGPELVELATQLAGIVAPFEAVLNFIPRFIDAIAQDQIIAFQKDFMGFKNALMTAHGMFFDQFVEMLVFITGRMVALANDPRIQGVSDATTAALARLTGLTAPLSALFDFIPTFIAAIAGDQIITFQKDYAGFKNVLMTVHGMFFDQFVEMLAFIAGRMTIMAADPRIAGFSEQTRALLDRLTGITAPFTALLSFMTQLRTAVKEHVIKPFADSDTLDILGDNLIALATKVGELVADPNIRDLTTLVAELMQRLATVSTALSTAIKFMTDLRLWRYQTDLSARFTAFVTSWKMIVEKLDQLRIDVAKFITESFRTFITFLGFIAESLQKAVTVLLAISAWKRTTDLIKRAEDFAEALTIILTTLLKCFEDNKAILEAIDDIDFGTAFKDLMEGLSAAIALALKMPDTWTLDETVFDDFFDWATGAFWDFVDQVTEWAALQADPMEMGSLVSTMAAAFKDLIDALSGALDLAIAFGAGGWTVPATGPGTKWQAFFDWATDTFWAFVDQVTEWALEQEAAGLDPTTTATLVGTLVAAFKGLIDALSGALDLAIAFGAEGWEVPATGPGTKWQAFFDWATGTFWDFVDQVTEWAKVQGADAEDNATLVGMMATAFKSLMDALKAALELALAFPKDWLAPDPVTWASFMTWVNGVFTVFTTYVTEWAKKESDPLDKLTIVGQFAQTLGSLMSALQTALNVAAAVPDTWAVDTAKGGVWYRFTLWVQSVFAVFQNWITATYGDVLTSDPAKSNFKPLADFGTAMNNVFGGLNAALSVAAAVPDVWEVDPLVWEPFMDWIKEVMKLLSDWVVKEFPADYKFEPVISFGSAMSNVFGGLSNGLDVFKELQGLIPLKDNKITEFLHQVKLVMEEISNWCTAEDSTIKDAVGDGTTNNLGAFGTAMSNVFSGLQAGISLFDALGDMSGSVAEMLASVIQPDTPGGAGGSSLARKLGALLGAIHAVIVAFANFAEAHKGDWMKEADKFKAVCSDIIGVLNDALNLFISLDEHGMPTTTQIQAFIDALIGPKGIFTLFVQGIADVLSDIKTKNGEIGAELAKMSLYLPSNEAMQQLGINLLRQLMLGMSNYVSAIMPGEMRNIGLEIGNLIYQYIGSGSQATADGVKAGRQLGYSVLTGLSLGIDPATAYTSYIAGLRNAIVKLVAYISDETQKALASGSPSMLFAKLAQSIPAGIALGITSGAPQALGAAEALFGQLVNAGELAPAWAVGGEWQVNAERRIIVEFMGAAGGGAPLDPRQFQELKSALAYEIRRRA